MSAEIPGFKATDDGGSSKNPLMYRFWLSGAVCGFLLLMLLSWGLSQFFELTRMPDYGLNPGAIPILLAVFARPGSFRESAIVAVVGGTIGTLATPCLDVMLPLADGLEPNALRETVRTLATTSLSVLLLIGGFMIYRQLARRQ